jgi:hypothetical protein
MPSFVASDERVWREAEKLALDHGGPRGVQKAVEKDSTLLKTLALQEGAELIDLNALKVQSAAVYLLSLRRVDM